MLAAGPDYIHAHMSFSSALYVSHSSQCILACHNALAALPGRAAKVSFGLHRLALALLQGRRRLRHEDSKRLVRGTCALRMHTHALLRPRVSALQLDGVYLSHD